MRATRRRTLTDQDRANWAAYVRTITPLPGHDLPDLDLPPPESPAPQPTTLTPKPRSAPARLTPLTIGLQPPGVDNASWQRFRTGKLAPSRTLDLHGQTAQRAYHSLHDFLRRAHADHQRCVEVITGRGAHGDGVLRRELPIWLHLSDLRPLILAVAHPHALNDGAVRILLRRIR